MGCGPGSELVATLERPIIHGKECGATDSPSAVGVILEAEVKSGSSTRTIRALICSGTLIAPDTVLTAAHCINVSEELKGTVTFKEEDYHVSFKANLHKLSVPDVADILSGTPAELPSGARNSSGPGG